MKTQKQLIGHQPVFNLYFALYLMATTSVPHILIETQGFWVRPLGELMFRSDTGDINTHAPVNPRGVDGHE